nr:D-alanyl-D-alanine carboxypeptidase/D-alanyl-D-alanine-endopeptidase [Hyphomonas sp. Mor2]
MSQIANRLASALRPARRYWRAVLLAGVVTAFAAGPVHSRDAPEIDAYPALSDLRFGLSVTDLEGNVLEAHRADERFMPASNNKLFVTAAALAAETDLSALAPGTQLVLQSTSSGPPNLALIGRGDPTLRFGPECTERCLETLAAVVAEAGITEVGDLTGDARWFADERRPLGWSWDDLKFRHGTAISALAVNDNLVPLRITPAREAGASVGAAWIDPGPAYFDLHNQVETSDPEGISALRLERRMGNRKARLYGQLVAGARSFTLDLAVDDPAHLAVWHFKQALEAEGVTVSGALKTQHRPLQYVDEPISTDPDDPEAPRQCAQQIDSVPETPVLTALDPAPLQDIVTEINRDSHNMYAEVLLRQLGRAAGTGSTFCGVLQIETFLDEVGVDRASYDIADGSGLSNYNRATPATMTALLRYAAAAPWGDAYKASLPVGGAQDGTLKYRFRGTALDGKVFAKTGTLNHVDALSGYMQARSGKTLVFSIIINDRPLSSPSAMPAIQATLLEIAERY